jgi:hypothetical protein
VSFVQARIAVAGIPQPLLVSLAVEAIAMTALPGTRSDRAGSAGGKRAGQVVNAQLRNGESQPLLQL